jgi:AmmeMemoRadiSam system protein B
MTTNLSFITTPLGKTKTFNTDFLKGDIEQEHSISNQYPFLQKLNIKEILPLMIGKITIEQAEEIAKKLSKIKALYVFSTDLSHFLPYENAVDTDKRSIKIIENLDFENFKFVDACGYFPLLVMAHLCKIKKTKPKLIEYKNSGDITGDKSGVVGYASFYF